MIQVKVQRGSQPIWWESRIPVPFGKEMGSADRIPPDRPRRVGLLVARNRHRAVLSPFFSNCDGLLILDSRSGLRDFRANIGRTSRSTCELILASEVTRLVCGFVPEPERSQLTAAGIDVRIGTCSRTVGSLVRTFDALPAA